VSYTLQNNAYHVLGLDVSASEKEILKRAKEILNRLKIDEHPDYDLDPGLFKDFRTEDSVKDSLQKLQAAKKKIKEYFFWLRIADSIDEESLEFLKKKDYSGAIHVWQKASGGQSTKALFYKKNLAILYCLVLSVENNKEYLASSLAAWKELIDSDKFWTSFSKVYKLHDEQTASKDILTDFKNHVVEYLSDIYTELHQIHKNADYINGFQKTFSVKGEKIEKSVLGPAYQVISGAVEGLETMQVSKDGVFDKEESEKIKQLVGVIQQELNKLIDLGLYEDSQTKIMRDRTANALRTIVLDLHNNLNEFDKSLQLLRVAIQICGTESLKNKLESEIQQIQKSISDDVENTLNLEIPGYRDNEGILAVKNNYIEFRNKRMFYKDITGVAYHSTKHTTSIYFIPVSTTHSYSFTLVSGNDRIDITFSGGSNNEERQQIFGRLVGLCEHLIEPVLVKKIVSSIFENGETVTIGGVEFSEDGYSRHKSAWFGKGEKETVRWTDTVYIPKLYAGSVYLFRDNDGKSQQFTSESMSTLNAVMIPELVKACVNHG